jgi:hypothetical protein
VKLGDRVRIRLANISMDSHPIHIHGHKFYVTGTDAGPIQESAWLAENTINVPVGSTRDIEFTADNPGDWAFHCHKSHHTMNQMGHELPNVIGVDTSEAQRKANELVPGTMIMGQQGMGDMMEHMRSMPVPRNSIPMMGAHGPFGPIEMGGMMTIIKIRETLAEAENGDWYQHPRGTVAWKVDSMSEPPRTTRQEEHSGHGGSPAAAIQYTCPMHPEVVSSVPGTCPKCGMKLVRK